MLGDAHGIKKHRALFSGVDPRGLANVLGRDRGDPFGELRRAGQHTVLERIEVLGALADEGNIHQAFGDDHVHHGVEQRHVGAAPVPQVKVAQLGDLGAPGIGHDDQRAAVPRFKHVHPDHGMLLRGVRADHKDDPGVPDLINRVRHGAGAESGGKAAHGGGMAEPGAVVDIVRADHGPRELHEHEVVLVRALGGPQDADGVGAVDVPELGELRGGFLQGFFPGGAPEGGAFLDERCGQAVGMLDEFVAVPALDAKGPVVHRMVAARGHAGDDVVFNMQEKAAAAAAPGAGRGYLIHTLEL